jgi:hypothetical protein
VVFDVHVGVDYSGAESPTSRLKGLQVYLAEGRAQPVAVQTPASPAGKGWKWTRNELAAWIVSLGKEGRRFILGIDHAFSFPATYLDRWGLKSWDAFLADFCTHWPTRQDDSHVDYVREGNLRTGKPSEFRLAERWTSSARSVFLFDVQGQVAKSTHAGIPWLSHIREVLGSDVHFWPFDGWDVPGGKSVIAEVYPSIFRRRYPTGDRGPDEQDAYAIARWLRDADHRDILDRYLHPPLSDGEQRLALLEGWILGIC